MAEKGTLVASGTFTVDRKRALEKLKDFQLSDPEKFLLLWVRCAVESGATKITLKNNDSERAVEMWFDGRPLTGKELTDPFICLFDEETPENARLRNLAVGLLSALRLNPKCITVTSGTGSNRVRLRVESLESTSLVLQKFVSSKKGSEGLKETILRVEWPMFGWKGGDDLLQHVRIQDHMLPIPITFSGLRIREGVEIKPWPDEQSGPGKGKAGPATPSTKTDVRLEVPGTLAYDKSVLRLHAHGVFVESVEVELPVVRVNGWINDDQFALNISRSGVVQDLRYHRALEQVAARAGQLLTEVIKGQAKTLTGAGLLLADALLLRAWKDWMRRGAAAEGNDPSALSKSLWEWVRWRIDPPVWNAQDARRVWQAARNTAWLREACARNLTDPDTDATDPTRKALWEAPVFLSVTRLPLTLAQLMDQCRQFGHVTASTEPCLGVELPYEVAWLTCEQDRTSLSRHFPGLIRDVTQNLASLAQKARDSQGAAGKKAGGLLERAGIFNSIIRQALQAGRFLGEIGLEMSPAERGARIVVLLAGKPSLSFTFDCGLRFSVAVEQASAEGKAHGSGTVTESEREEIEKIALQTARGLYPRLKTEFDHRVQTPLNDAIREHLLDYLVVAAGQETASAARAETDRWVEAVPLFKVGTAGWDFRRLRRAYDEGPAVYAALDRQAAKGLDGKVLILGCSADRLARLLPGVAMLEVPGRSGVQLLFKPCPKTACGHPAAYGCLIEEIDNGELVCVALGEQPDGQRKSFPWGTATVYPRGEKARASIPPPAQAEWGLELMIALVSQRGTLFNAPGDPARRILLRAIGYYLSPWPGRGQTPRHRLLAELLEQLPLFLRPDGSGWAIPDLLELRLIPGVKVLYLPGGSALSSWQADLLLTEEELALIVHLWPDHNDLLVPVDPSASRHVSLPPFPAPAYSEIDTPEVGGQKQVNGATESPGEQPSSSVQVLQEEVAAEPAAQEPGVLDQAHQILLHLHGRRGMKLLGRAVPAIRLTPSSGDSLLKIGGDDHWDLDESHPLAQAVFGATLSDSDRAVYLASLVYTAANRELSNVTDLDDVKFQQALADQLTEKPE